MKWLLLVLVLTACGNPTAPVVDEGPCVSVDYISLVIDARTMPATLTMMTDSTRCVKVGK